MIMKSFFRLTSSNDERVQALEYRAFAEAGFLVFLLLLLDVFVRAFLYNRPLSEWIVSILLIGCFSIYFTIRRATMGIDEETLLEGEELKAEKLAERISAFGGILYGITFIAVNGGTPDGWEQWLKQFYVLILLSGGIYLFARPIVYRIKRDKIEASFHE
ncbi:DUF6773 family protein [Metabacillus iocasae]|uniref:Uncharacterized protein n=1 Tax=Priestia iocasae TaxID=2291674 RepID=A0ABS2QSQ6_9BACI|nr:DUF6773 family protein [Metabacillus iocasae]MBM7702425.1 hypothetical protein [Metabacillus iocasae]